MSPASSSHPAPPDQLERDLELVPGDWDPRQVYALMTGLVVPRPIAWVSTFAPNGVRNVAPHSYFNVVAHEPPHVVFSSSGEKDTLRNVRANGAFVVNLVTTDVVEAMNLTAADFPPDEDEFTWAQLTAGPAVAVDAPRVVEARAHLECRLVEEVRAGNGHLVIGEVVHVHVDASVWRDGQVDAELLHPVARLAGSRYATLGEVFELPRPSWSQVRDTARDEAVPRR
ncbi:flavin reductase family protein [Egicoccus halophilus]|uniref:Flavin reductase n=1 Tax=Egicoccus halophilus TaxID=1670830 RepID=A0A8J3AAA8_9ACTN|nr:flavin reductase family protein [Egicoccus halophilus]GGI02635.1 flavin reductase [Egicoccus halophilus]